MLKVTLTVQGQLDGTVTANGRMVDPEVTLMFTMNFAPGAGGIVICPDDSSRVTVRVFGSAPEAGLVITKVPGFITEVIAAEKLPAPASEVLPD